MTPRSNMHLKQQEENTAEKKKKEKLISLIDQFTIFNGWMDGWTAERTQAPHDPGFFCQGRGEGIQARWPEYRIRTWDQYMRTYTYIYSEKQSKDMKILLAI